VNFEWKGVGDNFIWKVKNMDFLEWMIWICIIGLVIVSIFSGVRIYKNAIGIHQGYVYSKEYRGSYTTYIYSNNTMIPQYHGESYYIYISSDKYNVVDSNYCEIPPMYYKDIKVGQLIDCNNLDK
jgi:hypothetical protein